MQDTPKTTPFLAKDADQIGIWCRFFANLQKIVKQVLQKLISKIEFF